MAGATSPPTRETRKRAANKKALEEITPLPPPLCPSENALWNVDTCLKLASYYRGYSKLSERKAKRAKDAAISLIQRGKTREQVIKVYWYLLCLDKQEDGTGVYDEWWDGKEVDIWHVNEHIDVKLREIERKRKEAVHGKTPAKNDGVRLIGGKPSDELTEAEIDALPTPFLRKAARAARSSPANFLGA